MTNESKPVEIGCDNDQSNHSNENLIENLIKSPDDNLKYDENEFEISLSEKYHVKKIQRKKKYTKINEQSLLILLDWFEKNIDCRYANSKTSEYLALKANLSIKQV